MITKNCISMLFFVLLPFLTSNQRVNVARCDAKYPLGKLKKLPLAKFKSVTLEGQVEEAMKHAKENVLGYIIDLMEYHQNKPDQVLFYVEKYMKDPNESVRFAVVIAASQTCTKKSMEIMAVVLPDNNVSHSATGEIYHSYTRQQIISQGRQGLREALVKSFVASRYASYQPLLLALFQSKKGTVTLLKRRLLSYKGKR